MEKPAWEIQLTLTCKADRSFIWSFLTNLTNWERLEGSAVNWIRIYGPFEAGTRGETKMPDQMPIEWTIGAVEAEKSMVIETPLEGATLYSRTMLETIEPETTRITRIMSLSGPQAAGMVAAMEGFEKNAPAGLAKMVEVIEATYAEDKSDPEL